MSQIEAPEYKNPEFDSFAEDYDVALARGLAVSGENKEFFARKRIEWVEQVLAREKLVPGKILDFGCGTGGATPYLLNLPGAKSLLGLEVSSKSIKVARRLHPQKNVTFQLSSEYTPSGQFDFAMCNGVFHHIPVSERQKALSYIFEALRPGGLFALWENNPWNPGTRCIMSKVEFDKDAITLNMLETKSRLREAGFAVLRTDFLFIFPRSLSFLRPLERLVNKLPLGGQYMALAKKP